MATSRKTVDLPRRPGFAKNGRPIKLLANHFIVNFNAKMIVYHYDVNIEPTVIGRDNIVSVYERLAQKYPEEISHAQPVFDASRNIYSASPLQGIDSDGRTFDVQLEGRNEKVREFKLTIKQVAVIKLSKLVDYLVGKENETGTSSVLQGLDIVLRYLKSKSVTTVGRSIFSRQTADTAKDLGCGHLAWIGYYQSLHSCEGLLTLNIDMAATAFYKEGSLIDTCCEYLGGVKADHLTNISDANLARLKKELKNCRIETRHGLVKRRYPIVGFTRLDSRKLTFTISDSEMSVEKYLYQRYGIRLQYPQLFCVQVGKAVKKIFLPLELCFVVPAQRYMKKLNDREVSEMIRFTARPARERKTIIESLVEQADFNSDPYARKFQLGVNNRMMEVDARVLEPVSLEYQGNNNVIANNGRWDLKNKRLWKCYSLTNWVLMTFEMRKNDKDANDFIDSFMRMSRFTGLTVENRPSEIICLYDTKEIEGAFHNLDRNEVQLVIFILPSGRNDAYAEVKRVADVYVIIPTQCLLTKNLKKCNPQFVCNLCLKINLKLGGTNAVVNKNNQRPIPFLDETTFVIGADVSHAGRGESKPSVAALVGSLDPSTGRYYSSVRVMKARAEIIDVIKEMAKELLVAHYQSTNIKPKSIIVYRDGLSDGQFAQAIDIELDGIKAACKELEAAYKPAITFIITKKRHRSRFFCKNNGDCVGRAGNIPPGTVVDTGVVSPRNYEFFLCSHFGLQGTSRPTHYVVLYDEIRMSPDNLQRLTYALCHLLTRCTNVVSLPAPTYYAHSLAYRFMQIMSAWSDSSDFASTLSDEKQEDKPFVETEISSKIKECVRRRLYFKNPCLFYA